MDSYVSPKDEIWFLRMCHHILNAVYQKCLAATLRGIPLAFVVNDGDRDLIVLRGQKVRGLSCAVVQSSGRLSANSRFGIVLFC
jgi:hypothetical protein